MSQPATEPTVTMAFVLRFWHEQAGAESRGRGRGEHVQSGQRRDFLCLDEMLRFLQQMGVTLIQMDIFGIQGMEHPERVRPV